MIALNFVSFIIMKNSSFVFSKLVDILCLVDDLPDDCPFESVNAGFSAIRGAALATMRAMTEFIDVSIKTF